MEVKKITIEVEAKNKEQMDWAIGLFKERILKAKKDIWEDGLKIIIKED